MLKSLSPVSHPLQAPFLGPMVNRVAEMLNYFLLHLAGPGE